MNDTKYIRWGANILVFPGHMTHADVARPYTDKGITIDGAGFIGFNTFAGVVMCYGESVSLGIKCHPRDVDVAALALDMVPGEPYPYMVGGGSK